MRQRSADIVRELIKEESNSTRKVPERYDRDTQQVPKLGSLNVPKCGLYLFATPPRPSIRENSFAGLLLRRMGHDRGGPSRARVD